MSLASSVVNCSGAPTVLKSFGDSLITDRLVCGPFLPLNSTLSPYQPSMTPSQGVICSALSSARAWVFTETSFRQRL